VNDVQSLVAMVVLVEDGKTEGPGDPVGTALGDGVGVRVPPDREPSPK
jgi:hypothetical protein